MEFLKGNSRWSNKMTLYTLNEESLQALIAARKLAMERTQTARIPESGDFGAIAQDLDFVVESILPAKSKVYTTKDFL